MRQACKLCGIEKELLKSHIIPKFVFKWMRNTGGKFFRAPLNPNVRLQDGIKKKLLCKECEKKFSTNEKWFSENIFYPYMNTNNNVLPYNNKLAKFIISVLWRVLILSNDQEENSHVNHANADWRDFLLNNRKTTRYSNIHLVFIPDDSGGKLQPNEYMSRYFSRISDGGMINIDNSKIIFAKFARFFLFGEIYKNETNFRGTQISMNSGVTMHGQYIVNEKISQFFINRAFQVHKFMENKTSKKQRTIIINEIKSNLNPLLQSDLGKRIMSDVKAKVNPNGFRYVFNYNCDCCTMQLEAPKGYLLRTFEIIQSKKYWKYIFKTQSIGIDEEGLELRTEYFKRISSFKSPWVICDNCISIFDINLEENKKYMDEWVKQKGDYYPPKSGDFREFLSIDVIQKVSYDIVTIE